MIFSSPNHKNENNFFLNYLDFSVAKNSRRNPVGIDPGSRRNRIVNATEMQLREVFEKCFLIKTKT